MPQSCDGVQSEALAINDAGQVVGWADGFNGSHAFLWTPNKANGTKGVMTDLGPLGNSFSTAWGINADQDQQDAHEHRAGQPASVHAVHRGGR